MILSEIFWAYTAACELNYFAVKPQHACFMVTETAGIRGRVSYKKEIIWNKRRSLVAEIASNRFRSACSLIKSYTIKVNLRILSRFKAMHGRSANHN